MVSSVRGEGEIIDCPSEPFGVAQTDRGGVSIWKSDQRCLRNALRES
jgi:hypothetical protein